MFGGLRISRKTAWSRLSWTLLLAMIPLVSPSIFPRLSRAAEEFAPVDPHEFGFDIPAGPLQRGEGQSMATADDAGRPVVTRLLVRVGDAAIVMLPDGQLVARQSGQFAPTDRKFTTVDKAELATELTADEFKGFKTLETRHYLFVYNTSEEFAQGTSRILETMLPGVTEYAKAQRIEVNEPEVPLVAVMFKTEEEFQKFRRMPEGVIAYYQPVSNRVYMYEQSRLAKTRPDLAIQQSIATIAHEGAHQILHNIGVQQRLSVWPMWLGEGLAEYFAPTSLGARLKWKGAGQVNDMRMFELEQYLKSRASEKPDGTLVAQTVLAGRLTSTGYASAWALTHYLAKNRRVEFNQLVREASQLGPLECFGTLAPPGIVRANQVIFLKTFGNDLPDLETRLVAHLRKQPYSDPFAALPHYVAAVIYPSGKRTQRDVFTFHSAAQADKWLRETLGKLSAAEREAAQQSVRQFPNRQAAENYARQLQSSR